VRLSETLPKKISTIFRAANSGISKNSVNKTVRGNAAKLLSEERSDEFNESSVHEKVFSCFIDAGELFFGTFLLAAQKKVHPVVVTTKKIKLSTRRDARFTYQSKDALETFGKGKMPLLQCRNG
jgi:hypothetical protein